MTQGKEFGDDWQRHTVRPDNPVSMEELKKRVSFGDSHRKVVRLNEGVTFAEDDATVKSEEPKPEEPEARKRDPTGGRRAKLICLRSDATLNERGEIVSSNEDYEE